MSTTLETRYGAPAPWRRRAVIGAAVALALVFGGWLAWTAVYHSTPQASSELETFSVDGQHQVTAVLVVSLASADVRATCTLRAFAEDHSTVGELSFTPDPSAGRRQVVQIRTEREATAVEKIGCTAPGQDRPR